MTSAKVGVNYLLVLASFFSFFSTADYFLVELFISVDIQHWQNERWKESCEVSEGRRGIEWNPAKCSVCVCVKNMAAVLWSPRTASKPVRWLKRESRRENSGTDLNMPKHIAANIREISLQPYMMEIRRTKSTKETNYNKNKKNTHM